LQDSANLIRDPLLVQERKSAFLFDYLVRKCEEPR
jgi:hypothetical protein